MKQRQRRKIQARKSRQAPSAKKLIIDAFRSIDRAGRHMAKFWGNLGDLPWWPGKR